MKHVLSDSAIEAISDAIELLFTRAKTRFLGPKSAPRGKKLGLHYTDYDQQLSLPGIFEKAANIEGTKHDERSLNAVTKIAGSYLDATKERAKAKLVQKIQAFIEEATQKGKEVDVDTVLGGQLTDTWAEVTNNVKRIFETETNTARNTSIGESISKVGAATGNPDPTVFFVCVHDNALCDECKRLHLMENEITPRLWKMSELGSGYHKKGDPSPKLGGLHPNERCVLTILMPGFGFDGDGLVAYITPEHNELENQRK